VRAIPEELKHGFIGSQDEARQPVKAHVRAMRFRQEAGRHAQSLSRRRPAYSCRFVCQDAASGVPRE
jgi:hypothetical protein